MHLIIYTVKGIINMINSRTWAEINSQNLINNYNYFKTLSKGKIVIPVIKADAYGHGAIEVARSLISSGVNIFAVATVTEAVELKEHFHDIDVIILGVTNPEEFNYLSKYDIIQTVPSLDYANLLNTFAKESDSILRCHIKINTGMNRIGVYCLREDNLEYAFNEISRITKLDFIRITGIFTHFSTSERLDDTNTLRQMQIFKALLLKLKSEGVTFEYVHSANTGFIKNYSDDFTNAVRLGIGLYGYSPDGLVDPNLKPVMSLKTKVSFVHSVKKGDPIGYGMNYIADRDMNVAVLPVGYADGYSRQLSNKGIVLSGSDYLPVIGNVCMDQIMIDLNGKDLSSGDTVLLFGNDKKLNAEYIARICHTISYEVLCNISKRVPRLYT